MGQYHYIVNLDKQEFIHPHKLGAGLKLWEQAASGYPLTALLLLLAVSNGRGGGDFSEETDEHTELIGSWGGDRIAIVGDYAEDDDMAPEFEAGSIYHKCAEEEFEDISERVRPLVEAFRGVRFTGDGWRDVQKVEDWA